MFLQEKIQRDALSAKRLTAQTECGAALIDLLGLYEELSEYNELGYAQINLSSAGDEGGLVLALDVDIRAKLEDEYEYEEVDEPFSLEIEFNNNGVDNEHKYYIEYSYSYWGLTATTTHNYHTFKTMLGNMRSDVIRKLRYCHEWQSTTKTEIETRQMILETEAML